MSRAPAFAGSKLNITGCEARWPLATERPGIVLEVNGEKSAKAKSQLRA